YLYNFSQGQNESVINSVLYILVKFIFNQGTYKLVKSRFYVFLKECYEKGYDGINISLLLTKLGYFDEKLLATIIRSVDNKNKMLLEILRTNKMICKLTRKERNSLLDILIEKRSLLSDDRDDKILSTEIEHWIRLLPLE
ncbi:MAG: hypothetical protein ACTSQQ_08160, partial [Candidatus Helarchaeota archaeon]